MALTVWTVLELVPLRKVVVGAAVLVTLVMLVALVALVLVKLVMLLVLLVLVALVVLVMLVVQVMLVALAMLVMMPGLSVVSTQLLVVKVAGTVWVAEVVVLRLVVLPCRWQINVPHELISLEVPVVT